MEGNMKTFKANTDIGQNFLVDTRILHKIVAAAEINSEDVILEIGAGKGVLTRRLLGTPLSRLHSVEIDRRLAPFLSPLEEDERLTISWGDVLKMDLAENLRPRPVKIVANLPYHITTPVIWKVLEELAPRSLHKMILMVQKEAADRLVWGKPGKNRSPLGVTLLRMGSVERLFDVPPNAFNPPPKVNSTVIAVSLGNSLGLAVNPLWRELLRRSFSQRRKTLFNNLKGWEVLSPAQWECFMRDLGFRYQIRAEELSGENWEDFRTGLEKVKGGF